MNISILPSGQACGATITGVDLTSPLSPNEVFEIRDAWLKYHVLAFPDQPMSDDHLEAFTLSFGPFGDDPFIAPIAGRKHIIAISRGADEKAPVFAEAWHTDWSFQETPPAGTCLFAKIIPPIGGDTLFINQHKVAAEMHVSLREKLAKLQAVHSAKIAYAPGGAYDEEPDIRAMDIRPSAEAIKIQTHPIIRHHPETNEKTIFGCMGYIIGIDGKEDSEAMLILSELYQWQTQERFQYRHKWQKDMLVMWDNRSVLHMATSGYEGHERLLHRTTIGERI